MPLPASVSLLRELGGFFYRFLSQLDDFVKNESGKNKDKRKRVVEINGKKYEPDFFPKTLIIKSAAFSALGINNDFDPLHKRVRIGPKCIVVNFTPVSA